MTLALLENDGRIRFAVESLVVHPEDALALSYQIQHIVAENKLVSPEQAELIRLQVVGSTLAAYDPTEGTP